MTLMLDNYSVTPWIVENF